MTLPLHFSSKMNIMNSSDELAGLSFPTDGSTVLAVPTDLRREGGSFVLTVPVSLKSQLHFVLAVADLTLSPFFFFFFWVQFASFM